VKAHLGLLGLLGGGAIALTAALPAHASATQVTDVQVSQTAGGMSLILETNDGERPQVFTINRGNTVVADLTNTQLRLADGNGFLQNDPAPGIAVVMVNQLDANSVRVSVTGSEAAPTSQVSQSGDRIVFNIGGTSASAAQPNIADNPFAVPDGNSLTFEPANPNPSIAQATPNQNFDILVPDPQVIINGVPAAPSRGESDFLPPLRPRAIAPPVGDIAVSTTNVTAQPIMLGTNEVVPRLVLRDAPVRDVLSLLGRAAGLNVAFLTGTGTEGADGADAETNPRISLDIENEPVQNVFNYVLRISGLQANLDGRTIFVGSNLPNDARGLIMRTVRLNQVDVGSALNFMVALGAETAVSRERLVTSVNAVPVSQAADGGATSSITQTQTTTEQRIEVQRVVYEDSVPILRGLQVAGDERTNSLTITGPGQLVEIATSQLTTLDIRRRQVAVNVRVIDVNLLETDRASTSFSFGLGLTDFINQGGTGIINFGERVPNFFNDTFTGNPASTPRGGNDVNFADNFLAQLQAEVVAGNAKILTDPTLVVQEGQTAEVQLTADVVTDLRQTVTTTEGGTDTVTLEVETEPAGLVLQIQVERIDDNGFVSLSVAPSISAISDTVSVSGNQINLLSERRLSSGLIRVRDGQTLVLSGIIRDEDRVTVTKVPILGDIPILGALFRSSERSNTRQELIVILTPQILDDSEQSTFGYRYQPGPEVREINQR